jgi:hypothetical protein
MMMMTEKCRFSVLQELLDYAAFLNRMKVFYNCWINVGLYYIKIIPPVFYKIIYTGCPTRYQTRHVFFTVSLQLGARQTHTTDTFLIISQTTNVPLFKFRWNMFICFRIINEIPGSVASGTPCILLVNVVQLIPVLITSTTQLTSTSLYIFSHSFYHFCCYHIQNLFNSSVWMWF